MKLSDLKLNPNNPRTIKDAKFKKLCNSIRDFPKMMELRPIVIDKANGNMILGGNMRLLALKKLGFTEIPNEWVRDANELTEDEKKRFIIEDNFAFGEWDMDILANSFDTSDLIEWGFEENELGIEESPDLQEPKFEEKEEQRIIKCIVVGRIYNDFKKLIKSMIEKEGLQKEVMIL